MLVSVFAPVGTSAFRQPDGHSLSSCLLFTWLVLFLSVGLALTDATNAHIRSRQKRPLSLVEIDRESHSNVRAVVLTPDKPQAQLRSPLERRIPRTRSPTQRISCSSSSSRRVQSKGRTPLPLTPLRATRFRSRTPTTQIQIHTTCPSGARRSQNRISSNAGSRGTPQEAPVQQRSLLERPHSRMEAMTSRTGTERRKT